MSRWPMFGCYLIPTLATLWTIEAASLGGIDRPALQFAAGEGDLHRVLSVADPQEVIKGVREAQADLERRRRAEVPRWKSLTCDDKVGRHCLLFPPYREYRLESDSLRQAREALLGSLAAAGNAMPGDEWVLGQRIRYLLEGGQKRQALELTLDCRVERRWWCSALAGYVLHQMQRYEPADSAFEVARAAMPDAERRRWNDISVFLDDELGKAYREATAEGRDSLERRFWWLADPLYVIAGNDRRTEHYARHVQSTLLAEAESGFGEIDESDLRQIIVRHGLPSNWVTFEAVTSRQGDWLMPKRIFDAPLVAVYYPQRRRFVPHPRFLLDPTSIKPREWELEPEAPRASYDPLHLSFFGRLEHQVAVFERHDSAVVIAAFDQSVDWEAGNDRIDVALIFTAGESATPLVHRKRQREPRGVFVATLPRRPTLLSFELRSPVLGRAARARYGLRLQPRDPLRLTMSDLLVLTRADALPQTLEQAISSACGSLRARGGKRFGLYWEVYGLGPDGEPVEFSIAMYKVGKGELRSLEDLPAGAASALQLEWEEVAPAGTDIWGRAVVVELPEDLSPGLYVVCLTLSTFGREPVQTARALYVGS